MDEGGYGCVYFPGISCDGKKSTPKFITKIQKLNDTLKNEYQISQKIRGIKGYTKHFAPIVKLCPVKLTKFNTDEIQKCTKLSEESKSDIESPKYVSSKVRYAGKLNIGKYIRHSVEDTHDIVDIVDTQVYILKGLHMLNNAGIIHYDIKSDNIIYDATLKVPIIIDYGLSIYKPDLAPNTYKDKFFAFAAYSYWCIDIVTCSYIFRKMKYTHAKTALIAEEELNFIYDSFIESMHGGETYTNSVFLLSIISKTKYEKFREKYDTYFRAFIGKTWFELYEHLMSYSDTWDNYSVSVMYLMEMNDIRQSRPKTYNTVKTMPSFQKYLHLLETCVFSMPNERPNIPDTISNLKQL